MRAACLHEKPSIERALRRDIWLHLYELGDLDEFFWPYTTWYGPESQTDGPIVLLYTGVPLPNLIALDSSPGSRMPELLRAVLHLLPARFYSHLSKGLRSVFEADYRIESHGHYLKMGLRKRERLEGINVSEVVPLTARDLAALNRLYQDSYPEHWFDQRMLETGCYFGIRQREELVSVAGIHVFSPGYRVAVLGNVTTRTDCRGQGLGRRTCARLCMHLVDRVDHIGLNVSASNAAAIRIYEGLGFEVVGEYDESMHTLKR